MSKGLPRSLGRINKASSQVAQVARFNRTLTVPVTGATGEGWGTGVIGDLPEGNISILSAAAYITIVGPVSGVVDQWDGDVAIGSAATADGTLNALEVDIIQSSAIAAEAASKDTLRTRFVRSAAPAVIDNTAGTSALNFNLHIDDADLNSDEDYTVTVELDFTYAVLGDD